MGLYVKGVLGSFSGKVGTVVGANWRSINYLRSLPKPSKKPATEKQLAHRAKFALAINFLSPLRELINIGYNDSGQQKETGFNRATSHVISLVEGDFPDFSIPYEEVVLSNGSLQPVRATVDLDAGGASISWTTGSKSLGANPDDVVNMVFYDTETDDFFIFQDATRAEGSYVLAEEDLPTGAYHLWVFATSADNSKRSKSIYVGNVSI